MLNRPILMNSNGKKPKYIHQIYDDNVCVEQVSNEHYLVTWEVLPSVRQ